jgi:triosephosphate isomerase (TIM)
MTQRNEFATVRRPFIAGNWKMNLGPTRAVDFCRAFTAAHPARHDRSVALFPPAVSLEAVVRALADRPDILVGVQNIHDQPEGAFTGETGAAMAHDAGARLALAGHSERRHIFGESDEAVGRKAAAAQSAGMVPVICVGETLEERRGERLEAVLSRQLDAALATIPADGGPIIIAYEPVWAIGTGVNATPDDAAGAHGFLRGRLGERLGGDRARDIPILYGGSVKADNAADLLAAADVDGVLVGGASLDPAGFARIAAAAWSK